MATLVRLSLRIARHDAARVVPAEKIFPSTATAAYLFAMRKALAATAVLFALLAGAIWFQVFFYDPLKWGRKTERAQAEILDSSDDPAQHERGSEMLRSLHLADKRYTNLAWQGLLALAGLSLIARWLVERKAQLRVVVSLIALERWYMHGMHPVADACMQ